MSSEMIVFQFENQTIRVVEIDGVVMFGARDAALMLEYKNPAKAYNDHCKSLKKLSYNEALQLGWEDPNPQGEYVMPEADMFRLIMKSQMDQAERIQDWIVEEVLPSIRKTGSYSLQPKSSLEVLQLAVNALVDQERRVKELEAEQKALAARQQATEDRVALLDSGTGYMAIRGFCKVHNLPCPLRLAQQYGKDLSKMCRERGLPIGRVTDEAFGVVGSYPVELIAEYFEMDI